MEFFMREVALAVSLLTQQQVATVEPEALICMARNITFEAAGEATQGRIAVGQVTMNRVRDRHFPGTVCGVVEDPAQFSWYWDGKSDAPHDWAAFQDAMWVGFQVITGQTEDIVHGATQYYAHAITTPYWVGDFTAVALIGGHTFMRK